MKSATSIVVIMWLIAGCSPPHTNSGIPVHPINGKKPTALECEAAKWGEKLWKPTIIADSCYVWCWENGNPILIRELKDPTISIYSEMVSDADRLNGLEWTGHVGLSGKANRYYFYFHSPLSTRSEPDRVWSEWKTSLDMNAPSPLGVSVEKRKGKWQITESERRAGMLGKYRQISTSDIPR